MGNSGDCSATGNTLESHQGGSQSDGAGCDFSGRDETFEQSLARLAERTAVLEATNALLREKSTRLELALAASQGGVSFWETGSGMVDCDDRVRTLYGYACGERLSVQDILARVHPADRRILIDDLAAIDLPGAGDQWNHEYRIMHPLLGERWIARLGRVERNGEGRALRMLGLSFDITERKQTEQSRLQWNQTLEQRVGERTAELYQSEARFRQLAEATFEGIAISEEGILIDGNPQLAEIHGYELAEMIGRPITDFIAPASFSAVLEKINRGCEETYECFGLRKDGSTFPEEVRVCLRIRLGRVIRLTALRDLTKLKQTAAQLQAQQTELDHAHRLGLISEVSAGIIHQIGQPLCAMGANLAAAMSKAGTCEKQNCGTLEIIRDVNSDVARMRDVVVHLRSLVNPGRMTRTHIDFNSMIMNVLGLLAQESARRGIRLKVDLCDELPKMDADSVQLSQVVFNLIQNAFDACEACPPERRFVEITTRLDGSGSFQLDVRDTGTGVSAEVMESLFAPFFTTKPEGLGMGLRLSQTIVHTYGGTIEGKNNDDGLGASFRVSLPVDFAGYYAKV